MRKLVSILLIFIVLSLALVLPISAAAPDYAVAAGFNDLWYVGSTYWDRPGNVAVNGDTNTYYQWFYTFYPFYRGLAYDVPLLVYTYDGSLVGGGNPDYKYALRLSQDSSGNVLVEYIRIAKNNSVSIIASNRYVYGSSYNQLITFCGWGMDSTGYICYLLDIDGSMNYVRVAASPNGDKHLYADPNFFDGLYILGFNTMKFGGQEVNQTRVIGCYNWLHDRAEGSANFESWVLFLKNLSGWNPDLTDHVFQIYNPKSSFDLGAIKYDYEFDPDKPLRENISSAVSFDMIRNVRVDPFSQKLFADADRCIYDIYVSQTIHQYKGSSTFYIDYNITITGRNPDPLGSDFTVLTFAYVNNRSPDLFDRLQGVTFRPGTCAYPLSTPVEEYFNDAEQGRVMYSSTQSLSFSVTYQFLRSSLFKLYLVSDASNWSTLSTQSEYIDKLQQSVIDKYQGYIDSVFIDLEKYHLTFSGNDVISQLFGIPSMMYLVTLAASLIIVKVVLFK